MDDLIENNRRRIELLERAAREIYCEWFARLQFPGHEYTKIINGIPEGWARKSVFEVIDVVSGGAPRTGESNYWDGKIPFITPKNATTQVYAYQTERTLTEDGLRNCKNKLYPKNTIFLTARGTVGKINLAQAAMAMNQSCYALTAKNGVGQVFSYFTLVEGGAQLRSRAVGSVFDAIVTDTFKRIPLVEPSGSLIGAFNELATPLVEQVGRLVTQVRYIVKAHKPLLPRLMDGRVQV